MKKEITFIFKTNQNIYGFKEIRFTFIIKDIFLLKDQKLALIDNKNNFYILKKIDNEYSISWSLADIDLFFNDLNDKSRFFIMKNKPDFFKLKYYYELKKNISKKMINIEIIFYILKRRIYFLLKIYLMKLIRILIIQVSNQNIKKN